MVLSAPDPGHPAWNTLGLRHAWPLLGMGFDGNIFTGHLAHLRHLSRASMGRWLERSKVNLFGAGWIRDHSGHLGGPLLLQSAPHDRKDETLMPFVLGLNHRTAPVDLREKLAVAAHQLPELLARLLKESGSDEVVCLSTCNRTEIYAQSKNREASREALRRALEQHAGTAGLRNICISIKAKTPCGISFPLLPGWIRWFRVNTRS